MYVILQILTEAMGLGVVTNIALRRRILKEKITGFIQIWVTVGLAKRNVK